MRNEKKKNFDASTIVRAYQKITLEDAMNLTKLQKAEHKRITALRGQELRYGDGTYLNKAFEKDLPKDNDMTVTPQGKQLDKFLAAGENVDSLYALFSELLDRKLKEMNTNRATVETEGEDIQDDYMRQMTSASNSGSHQNLRQQSMNNEVLQTNNPYLRGGRRQSTGEMNDKQVV